MNGELMKKVISDLTAEQIAELEALAALPDDQINTDDIREVTNWSNAQRGLFYRPIKQYPNSEK
jgi:hypothetical protein